jgi:N-acyl-D-amino-acid deacylase
MIDMFFHDTANGALGLSTGLSYPPALASDSREIAAMLLATGPKTLYVTHLRSYGKDFDSALDEALDIINVTDCLLHLSHFHVSGPGREDQAAEYLARLEGLSSTLSLDSYPYRHACTFLTSLLPSRLQEVNYAGLQHVIRAQPLELAAEIAAAGPEATISVGWEGLIVAGLSGMQAQWNGLSLSQIGVATGESPEVVICRLLSKQLRSPMVLVPQGHNANIRAVAESAMQVVGSDGIFGSGAPHPRLTGTFFRFLRLVLDGALGITVEEAVAKMTSKTASIFGLKTGVIAPGYPADLLVLDPARIDSGDDVVVSRPASVQHSFINGEPIIKDGVWQERKLSGMAVRRDR